MPLSQAISDTDCIMRDYNQLTAAGSYGERMILNRNQYKLNLTPSPTEQSSELETREGSSDRSGGFRVGQGVLGQPPWQPGDIPDVPLPSGRRLELPSPSLPPSAFLTFLSSPASCSVSRGYQVDGTGFFPSLIYPAVPGAIPWPHPHPACPSLISSLWRSFRGGKCPVVVKGP